jgi:hypothetical protein
MIITQPDLFTPTFPAVPYQRNAYTSRAAADRARPHANNHEQIVYDCIVAAGERGVTRKELSHLCGFAEGQQNRITGRVMSLLGKRVVRELEDMSGPTGSPRIIKLRRDGSVILVASRYQQCQREGE